MYNLKSGIPINDLGDLVKLITDEGVAGFDVDVSIF